VAFAKPDNIFSIRKELISEINSPHRIDDDYKFKKMSY